MKKLLLLFSILLFVPAMAAAQNEKPSASIVTIAGEPFYVHPVKPGDTFYSLTRLYKVSEQDILKNNPQTAEGLQSGQVLKIPVVSLPVQEMTARQKRRQFEVHVVNQGETAYSISRRYGISIATLIEDNEGFDPLHLSIGQHINIRTKEQGKTSEEEIKTEMANYRDALNSVSDGFQHHIVQRGETLYSLGRLYQMPLDSITKYNREVLAEGLKEGSMLRIPAPETGSQGDTAAKEQERDDRRPVDLTDYFRSSSDTDIEMKRIDVQAPVKVAMLLPLRVEGRANRGFLEFYQGALIALDELKAMGISSRIDLYNTARSEEEVNRLLRSGELDRADLIIGPVYEEVMRPVADYARQRRIPVVSPLAPFSGDDHSLLYQAAPSGETKNDKLRAEMMGNKNVVVFSTAQNDPEMEREIAAILPPDARRVNYTENMPTTQMEELLSGDKENILVILAGSGNAVEKILAHISSVQNNLVARSIRNPSIRVVGSSNWAYFDNIDKNLFFKLNVMYITNYHADRGNPRITNFDRKYVSAFSSLPSKQAYRGYDVTKLFAGNLKLHGNRFPEYLNDGSITLLQTPYRFRQSSAGRKYVNDEWALVCYRGNYTIDVK